jgi:hypothetical protein
MQRQYRLLIKRFQGQKKHATLHNWSGVRVCTTRCTQNMTSKEISTCPINENTSLALGIFRFFFFWRNSPTRARSHTTHHSRQDSSGVEIGPSHRPLLHNTTHTSNRHHAPDQIRTCNTSKRVTADPRLTSLGH